MNTTSEYVWLLGVGLGLFFAFLQFFFAMSFMNLGAKDKAKEKIGGGLIFVGIAVVCAIFRDYFWIPLVVFLFLQICYVVVRIVHFIDDRQ